MNDLYGPEFIVKQRKSGYKSTVYAMAEIVDNSIDAGATKVDIILLENTVVRGQRKRESLFEIYFLDNGKGMTKERINGCLTFSHGEGSSNERIGAFGVGLPNSSISVGKKVEVYSKDEDEKWNYVFLDIDLLVAEGSSTYPTSEEKDPEFITPVTISSDVRTIVKWSELDLIDVAKAKTLRNRVSQLLGRIYRYSIKDGLTISIGTGIKGNSNFTEELTPILPYDPLFVMKEKNFITEHIWKWARQKDASGTHKILGEYKEEYNSMYHYAKLIDGYEENVNSISPFSKYDDYWNVEYKTRINGKDYKWRIFASLGKKEIINPGVRGGGGTKLGKLFGQKMSGKAHFRSGNIYFMRANREIDFGNFGLYTVTDEKNRFWTVEIHFNSDLDHLMGVSNTKQNVEFFAVNNVDVADISNDEHVPEGVQREILYSHMTETIGRCIKQMQKKIKEWSREWREKEKIDINELGLGPDEINPDGPVPKVEHLVFEVLPKEDEWSAEQKENVAEYLKTRYMTLSKDQIMGQIDIFSTGLTKTLVLYAPNESNNLFEVKEKKGILITFINTNHIYYQNIVEPLKYSPKLKVFTLAIEMLISSFSLEMNKLVIENETKFQHILDTYLLKLSSRLNEFIHDSEIKVKPEILFEDLRKEFGDDVE